MQLYERIEEALSGATPDDYVIALEWQGRQIQFATISDPATLSPPTILIVQRPKRVEEQERLLPSRIPGGEPFVLTSEQVMALRQKFAQHPDDAATFEEFKNRAKPAGLASDRYIVLQWCGMWLAIEPDGYTHS